jgi:hypothetical protein
MLPEPVDNSPAAANPGLPASPVDLLSSIEGSS